MAKYGHPLYMLETFVERGRFRGTCYKAANWKHVVKTTGRGRNSKTNAEVLPIKDVFVYLLDKRFGSYWINIRSGGEVMLNKTAFEYMQNLQYKVKDLAAQAEAYKSGENHVRTQKYYESQLAAKDREIRNLKLELTKVRTQADVMRDNWFRVFEDMESGHAKELIKKDRAMEDLTKQLYRAQNTIDGQKDKLLAKTKELYQALTELGDEKGKVLKLKAQISRDNETSSIPSSLKPNRKKITNNREKAGRRPGGRHGHMGCPQKKYEPTNRIDIPPTEKYYHPDYKPTGRIITKQLKI